MLAGALPPGFSERQPPLAASVQRYYLPVERDAAAALADWSRRTSMPTTGGRAILAYQPFLFAQAAVRYQDRQTGLFTSRQHAYLIPDLQVGGLVHWDDHEVPPVDMRRLATDISEPALHGDLPPGLVNSPRMTALRRELTDLIYATKRLHIPYNPTLKLYGEPDADPSVFRTQLQQSAREQRDAEVDRLTAKYEKLIDKVEDEMRRKGAKLDNEKRELAKQRRNQLFTTGEAVIGLLQGRTAFTLSRMSQSAVYKERSEGQANMLQFDLRELEQERQNLAQEYDKLLRQVNERWAAVATTVEDYTISPFKKDIALEVFGIGWLPFWYANVNGQPLMLPAVQSTVGF